MAIFITPWGSHWISNEDGSITSIDKDGTIHKLPPIRECTAEERIKYDRENNGELANDGYCVSESCSLDGLHKH